MTFLSARSFPLIEGKLLGLLEMSVPGFTVLQRFCAECVEVLERG